MLRLDDVDEKIGVRSRALRHCLLLRAVSPQSEPDLPVEVFVAMFQKTTGLALCALEPSWVGPDGTVDMLKVNLGSCRPLRTTFHPGQGNLPATSATSAVCTHPWLLHPACGRSVTAAEVDAWSLHVIRSVRAGLEPFASLAQLQPFNCLRALRTLDGDIVVVDLRDVPEPGPRVRVSLDVGVGVGLGVPDPLLEALLAPKLDLSLHVFDADRQAATVLCSLAEHLQQGVLRAEQQLLRQLGLLQPLD